MDGLRAVLFSNLYEIHKIRNCDEITHVSPITGIKLVSPVHLGTICMWRWSAIPAPPGLPIFMPILNPYGLSDFFMAFVIMRTNFIISKDSSSVNVVISEVCL